jgi:hypothetical protein
MDNPFAVGDLVHIPKGVLLYESFDQNHYAIPDKALERASVGLILQKSYNDFYIVSIGIREYLIRKEDMCIVTRKGIR